MLPRRASGGRHADAFEHIRSRCGQTRARSPQVRKEIFLALLEYLYTDQVDIPLDIAMELFQAADQFGVDRLKRICESKMLASIHVENAATIFHAAGRVRETPGLSGFLAFRVSFGTSH